LSTLRGALHRRETECPLYPWKADITENRHRVCFVPKGDIGPFHLAFSRRQITSSSVNGKRHRFSFEMG